MRRSTAMLLGAVFLASLLSAFLSLTVSADEPAKRTEAVKPPWQRLLQSADAKTAAEQEKRLLHLATTGQYAEALKAAEALVELRAKVQGADHWQAIDARFDREEIRHLLRATKEEQQSYSRAATLRQEADALEDKGQYREAQSLLVKALAIHRNVLGEEHPTTIDSCNLIALNLNAQGKYREAETIFRKALAGKCRALGEEHPATAISHNNLAQSLNAQGKHREAEEEFGKALAICHKVLGEEDVNTALMYNNVAYNLNSQSKYKEAEAGFSKALAIRRKALGEAHPLTAQSYSNVAYNLSAQGKYKEAEEGYIKALAIFRKLLGEEHLQTAQGYNNLAYNLNAQGKYHEAEAIFRKALATRRKLLGEEHPDTARVYDNLARNLAAQDKDAEAEELFCKALAIRRRVLGEEHPDTAASYNNMATHLMGQAKYQEAEENCRKSLAINRKRIGEEHPSTAISYGNLADSLAAQGKFKEAENDYGKALAIFRKHLGEEHPYTALGYCRLAVNLYAQSKYAESETFFVRAAEGFAKARLHIAATGLERAVFTSKRTPLPTLAAVLARNGKTENGWQRFEESLARGTWDDLSTRLRRPQAERDKQARIIARIERLNQLIAKSNPASLRPEQSRERDERLSQLRLAYDELASFTQQMEKQYGPIAGQVFPLVQIQAALSEDAAFVAWLDIAGPVKAADPNGEHWAILLRSTGASLWVPLPGSDDKHAWTDADRQLPAQLREALHSSQSRWQPLAERLRKQRLDPLARHLKGVHRLIVLPSTALAGVPVEVIADKYTVSYAHSGTMYAHLRQQQPPTGKGLFALADPVFDPPTANDKPQPLPPSGVLVTRVVPGSNAARSGIRPNDVLLRYGDTELSKLADLKLQPESKDPDKRVTVIVWRDGVKLSRPLFVRRGKLGVVFAQEPAPQALTEQRRLDRLLASRSGDENKWSRLPGTRFEVASLHRLFDKDAAVQVLLESDSSEQRLNELAQSGALGKYRYLHLATHGEVDNVFPLRSAVILSRDHLPDDKQRTELLLSGQPTPDGRLTAEEVLQRWNLNCELVTLSACQTALGKYERGEGYVGFAQALILCGTRSVCLSLWKVDDTATALLMERFYQNLLGKRDGLKAPLSKSAALAEAKAWLRTLPREEAMRRAVRLSESTSRGKGAAKLPPLEMPPAAAKEKDSNRPFAHPYYWAAFVLVGHAE